MNRNQHLDRLTNRPLLQFYIVNFLTVKFIILFDEVYRIAIFNSAVYKSRLVTRIDRTSHKSCLQFRKFHISVIHPDE